MGPTLYAFISSDHALALLSILARDPVHERILIIPINLARLHYDRDAGINLECLLELPKGMILASIEAADTFRAKEIPGGHTSLFVG